MSSAPKTSDGSILRKFEPSKKEEDLKKRLFQKKNISNQSSPTKPAAISKASVKKQDSHRKEEKVTSTRQLQANIPEQYVDNFLKEMESEFREMNKKQITIGMLNNQTEILKKHSEILNQNQQSIAHLIKENHNPNLRGSGGLAASSSQKELMKELISPINSQVAEIKKIYEQTKTLAEDVAKNVNVYKNVSDRPELASANQAMLQNVQQNMQQSFANYQTMNKDLKDMVYTAQGNLSQLLPENLQIIKEISNLNIQAYTDAITTLKKQIQDLQRDAEKAEKELEVRYKKLAELPKASSIKKNDPYYPLVESNPETAEEVIKQIRTIDYVNSRAIVMNKLGGEFDYDQFNDEVSNITQELHTINNKFQEDLLNYKIHVPPAITMTEQDKALLNTDIKLPSILDELKARYNLPKKPVIPKPRVNAPTQPAFGFEEEIPVQDEPVTKLKGKKKTAKPDTLSYVKSQPQEPEPDIEFVRYDKPGPRYDPIINLQVQREIKKEERRSTRTTPEKEREPERTYTSNIRETPQDRSSQRESTPPRQVPVKQTTPPKKREAIHIEDREEPSVHITMDRYNVPSRQQQEVRPRESVGQESLVKAKGNEWLMDHLLENMVLQDIKEQMVYASVAPTHDDSQEDPSKRIPQDRTLVETFRDDNKIQMTRENFGLFQPSVISPDYSMINNTNQSVDEKLLTQLTMQALAEKMPELIAENKKEKVASIFRPVDPQQAPRVDEQRPASENAFNLFSGINANQLSALLAENLMGLLNNAMLHINTSLSQSLPQVSQVPFLNQQNLQNVQRIQEQVAQPEVQKPEVVITEEKVEPRKAIISPFKKPQLVLNTKDLESEEKKEDRSFPNRNQTTMDTRADTRLDTREPREYSLTESLAREEREIQIEQALLKQQKPFATRPGQSMTPDIDDFLQRSFYFLNHEPQPITNLSEYYKELQSELSSSGEYNRQSIGLDSGRNNNFIIPVRQRDRDSVSQASRSEGQIFPTFETGGDEDDLPKFGKRPSSRGGFSDIGSDVETPGAGQSSRNQFYGRPLITDNLMRNLHEDDVEPGEVNIYNIFKA